MTSQWRYRTTLIVAIVGLALVASGLLMALLSNPSRFSMNVRDDQKIYGLVLGAMIATALGIGIFLKAISQAMQSIPLKQRREINVAFSVGLLLQLGAATQEHTPSVVMLLLLSVPLFIWGSVRYAAAKGYSEAYGVLGIVGALGLIVLVMLPDRRSHAQDYASGAEIDRASVN